MIMKTLLHLVLFLIVAGNGNAASTINTNNPYAYGANIGWINARADGGTNGAVIGEFYCSGYIYAANVGWISLGNTNGPANGYAYSNVGTDYGVNNVGGGQLSGLAYGANVGWIEFEQNFGKPAYSFLSGIFTGYIYSANCGWISLSNLQTATVSPAPLDANGLPIAWELLYFGTTNINPNADADGDGMSNFQEYLAGTNPNDVNDRLRITAISANAPGTTATLTWTSHNTRLYQVQERTNMVAGSWVTNLTVGVVVPDPGPTTTRSAPDSSNSNRFYRIEAIRPLGP
jgi:hypothetical protein